MSRIILCWGLCSSLNIWAVAFFLRGETWLSVFFFTLFLGWGLAMFVECERYAKRTKEEAEEKP